MRIEEFVSKVKGEIEKRTGETVEVREMVRNNGVVRHAIVVKNEWTNIAPVIYMEPYHEAYERKGGWKEILEAIYEAYRNGRMVLFDVKIFTDFEKAKGTLRYKLINAGLNRELLEEVPFEPFLDLAKVYYFSLETEAGRGSIIVRRSHLELWGISEQILKEAAERNMENADVTLDSVEKVLCDTDAEMPGHLDDMVLPDIYIMRLKELEYGAASMCREEVLYIFAEDACTDILILPSSIYEVILVPVGAADGREPACLEKFRYMVRDINHIHLEPYEWLSDNVYLYKRKKRTIEIA